MNGMIERGVIPLDLDLDLDLRLETWGPERVLHSFSVLDQFEVGRERKKRVVWGFSEECERVDG
jgi:hypothetical protein